MTKLAARKLGINPVWYVDMTPGRDWMISGANNELLEEAKNSGDFHNRPAAKLFPFFEQMGTWPGKGQKEFWWEREWRHQGDVWIANVLLSGALILCPEDELDHFEAWLHPGLEEATRRRRRRHCIDPRWGLEQIIAHLAGIPDEDVTPFGR